MGAGFCSVNICSDVEEQQYTTMEPRVTRPNSDIEHLAKQDFVQVSKSETDKNDVVDYDEDDDDATIPYATAADFSNVSGKEQKSTEIPDPSLLPSIAESRSTEEHQHSKQSQTTTNAQLTTATQHLNALRKKYTSQRVILPEKDKSRTPQCFDCGGFYHIQSDPITAYGGVGIVCELCGKNGRENPELLLEDHYYKCEQCENVDICCKCYQKEKEKLIK